jgi:hypothetical protein
MISYVGFPHELQGKILNKYGFSTTPTGTLQVRMNVISQKHVERRPDKARDEKKGHGFAHQQAAMAGKSSVLDRTELAKSKAALSEMVKRGGKDAAVPASPMGASSALPARPVPSARRTPSTRPSGSGTLERGIFTYHAYRQQ